jgi:hypothetical protein
VPSDVRTVARSGRSPSAVGYDQIRRRQIGQAIDPSPRCRHIVHVMHEGQSAPANRWRKDRMGPERMTNNDIVRRRSQTALQRRSCRANGPRRAQAHFAEHVDRGPGIAEFALHATGKAQCKVHRHALGGRPVLGHRPKKRFNSTVQIAAVDVKHANFRAMLSNRVALKVLREHQGVDRS